jgi:hypothetical protein
MSSSSKNAAKHTKEKIDSKEDQTRVHAVVKESLSEEEN